MYIAHKDGEREQSVAEHLRGTAELAGEFAAAFGKEDWGYCCGMLHDIGKYSDRFQEKIKGNLSIMVDHATAGAKLCKKQGGYYSFLSYCIAGHHAGLPDYGSTTIASSLCGRLAKEVYDYTAYQNEIEIPELKTLPIDMKKGGNIQFSLSAFIRMIYSCLVDADFLDTEAFMNNGQTKRESGDSVDILWDRLERKIHSWLENNDVNTVNGRRSEILRNCIDKAQGTKGLFKLTVPTGGGKTIASLAFALKHAKQNGMERVIYVIPYTSIIEQNAQVFRDILGVKNVLENHCNVDYKESEEFKPLQLAAENWDKPVVVTTNVQFFESLFSNKSSKCRKLHNIANSVIVFDEAQMLPLDYLKPCMLMMDELVKNYGSSIVLCTATQPALSMVYADMDGAVELCPRLEEQFSFFERVTYSNIGKISKEDIAERIAQEDNVLCIVNTKKRAQELFNMLKGEGVYHLSTSMYPKHRKRVLAEVKKRLDSKTKCILIATSLVEAGVDLDFKCVYRQLAGVDSIIQAAGRCNREGGNPASDSMVYVFDLNDMGKPISQRQQIDIAGSVIKNHENMADMACIQDYFERLYTFRGESLDKKNIINEFADRGYNFAKVGQEFRLIEQDTKTIFINKEREAGEILQDIKCKGASKERIRRAGQYCLQVYGTFFDKLYGAGMVRAISEDMQDFYELVVPEKYSEECGLDNMINDGEALFG